MAFLKTHVRCDTCGSSDGASINDNGSSYCFVCQKHTASIYTPDQLIDLLETNMTTDTPADLSFTSIYTTANSVSMADRRISKATAERYGVVRTQHHIDKKELVNGGDSFLFPYYDKDNALVAAKVRGAKEKTFGSVGDWNKGTLFGQQLFSSGGKYLTITEGECFLPTTKVLTREGWLALSEWGGQDVMTGEGTFETPLAKVDKHFDGEMLHFKSGSYETVVTPQHNLIRINPKNNERVKAQAQATNVMHWPVPRTVDYVSCADNIQTRLQVMLSADFTFRTSGDLYGRFKKQRKIDRCLMLLGLANVRHVSNTSDDGYTSIFIHRGHGLDVSKLFSFERDLPNAATVLDEVIHWDGNSVPDRNQIEFSSKEIHNATFVQTCAHLCGYVSTIIHRSNSFGKWLKVSILFGKSTSSTQNGFSKYLYTGSVQCLTMPSGTLLVSYKDSISVSGNCDALAVYQLTGSKYPSVSIRNGAGSALKDCKANYEYINSFENIIICFDGDAPGVKASKEVAELFGAKAKVFKPLPEYKDACDWLSDSKEASFVQRWWGAEAFIPDGIVSGSSLWDVVSQPMASADCLYPWEGLNKLTYGIRLGELVTVTAGSGLGKSQLLREIVWNLLCKTDDNIGLMFLEESVRKTGLSMMSLAANTPLHLPDVVVSEEERKRAFDLTLGTNRMFLFDHFGSSSIENILNRVRYMAKGLGCKYVMLDHLSIIFSSQDNNDERKAIDEIMTKLRTLVQETNISLIIVSHLKRPSDKGHEEGAATSLAQLRGSASIAQLSDMVISLERNGQHDDPLIRNTTNVRVLKNRFNGDTGPACSLLYSKTTGRMVEVETDLGDTL